MGTLADLGAVTADQKMRSYESWQHSLKCFEWLTDVVPGATDIDLMVERNASFLVFEAKPYVSGVEVPWGQHLCLYNLSRQPRTIVYLIGERNDRFYMLSYGEQQPDVRRKGGKTFAWWSASRFIPTNREGLREVVRRWWDEAG